jgi:predicted ATPase/DNA-binding SARP family transcriptional activator
VVNASRAPIRVEMLGRFRIIGPRRTVTRFRTRRAGDLLAYLAFHEGRAISREVLIELLWPEVAPARGRGRLRQALTFVRKELEPSEPPAIIADNAQVELSSAVVRTDVAELEATLARAASAQGDERDRGLRTAVGLYKGELLPGRLDDWIIPERGRLRARFLAAAHEVALSLLRSGDARGAIEVGLRAVAEDPLAEEARRDVMRAYARAGERAKAIAAYRSLEEALRRELGAPPSPATRELAREIELGAGRATARAISPAPVGSPARAGSPIPVGSPAPAAAGDDAIATHLLARLAEGDARRSGLNAVAAAHAAREVERVEEGLGLSFAGPRAALSFLAAVRSASPLPAVALATGRGARGLRARALALLAASHDGQVLCDEETAALLRREPEIAEARLRELGLFRLGGKDPERLHEVRLPGETREFPSPHAARALGGRLPRRPTRFFARERELETLAERLGPSRSLVTITGAPGIGKTRLAIEAAERLRSRLVPYLVPLGDLTDARLLPAALLEALGVPTRGGEPIEELARTAGGESILFVLDGIEHLATGAPPVLSALSERLPEVSWLITSRVRVGLDGEVELALGPLPVPGAGAAREPAAPSVALLLDRVRELAPSFEPASEAVLAAICRRLDGIPLALELAADWIPDLGPEAVLERLDERFALLVRRRRATEPRHVALRAAIDASWELLGAPERRLFARLSVFRGGFTVGAAEAVCREPRALALLARLSDSSLVLWDEPGTGRLRLLESLREYGEGRLPAREKKALAGRHARHFADLAARACAAPLSGERDGWLARLAAEQENLRAAFEWRGEPGARDTGALRIATALGELYRARGSLSVGRELLGRALAGSPQRTAARAAALAAAAMLAWRQADFAGTHRLAEESVALCRELGEWTGVVRGLNLLGIATVTRQPDAARALFEQCAAAALELGEEEGAPLRMGALHNRGCLDWTRGDFAPAKAAFTEAHAFYRAKGRREPEGESARMLALTCLELGEATAAREHIASSLSICRALGARLAEAKCLMALGVVEERFGDAAAARSCLEQGLASFRAEGARRDTTFALSSLADLALREGDVEKARLAATESVAMSRAQADERALAVALASLGRVELEAGEDDAAAGRSREALDLFVRISAKPGMALAIEALARCEARAGRSSEAAVLLGRARALRGEMGSSPPLRWGEQLRALEQQLESALGVAPLREALDRGRAGGVGIDGGAGT